MGELENLKKQAKKHYLKIKKIPPIGCGMALHEYINPDLCEAKTAFNSIWERIKKLDPNAPQNPFF